jgi:hypothetical protein
LDKAIEIAKGLANIPADKGIKRVIFPAPRTLIQQFFGYDDDEAEAKAIKIRQQRAAYEALPADVRRTLRFAAMMDQMRNGQTMMLMPYELTIK